MRSETEGTVVGPIVGEFLVLCQCRDSACYSHLCIRTPFTAWTTGTTRPAHDLTNYEYVNGLLLMSVYVDEHNVPLPRNLPTPSHQPRRFQKPTPALSLSAVPSDVYQSHRPPHDSKLGKIRLQWALLHLREVRRDAPTLP